MDYRSDSITAAARVDSFLPHDVVRKPRRAARMMAFFIRDVFLQIAHREERSVAGSDVGSHLVSQAA
jgi:hypothetical protein